MKNLLYIGNHLNNASSNLSSIHVLGKLLVKEGYTVTYASRLHNKVVRLIDMICKTMVKAKHVEYVIIDTYSTLNFYYALIISQLCRILRVRYIANLNGGNLPNRLKNSQKLSRLIFKNAYYNVAPSLYLKTIFEEYGYKNIVHIPNTIELKKYSLIRREFNKPKLLWVRSFSKIYNPELAIRVVKALIEEGFPTTLTMVGPDSDGSLAEVKALSSSLNVEVNFTGKLSKKEWIELSKKYNIFINTTNFDNMPVSVIEAMALGLPVVSTNVGGMPYLIENKVDGILVNPNSISEFVVAIKDVLLNPQSTTKMINNARKQVENYDWDKVKYLWAKVLS